MSRRAVSCDDFVSSAYLVVVSLPSNPSRSLLRTRFLACLGRAIDGAQTVLSPVLAKAKFWERIHGVAINDRQKPFHPGRNVHLGFLRPLKNLIVGVSFRDGFALTCCRSAENWRRSCSAD